LLGRPARRLGPLASPVRIDPVQDHRSFWHVQELRARSGFTPLGQRANTCLVEPPGKREAIADQSCVRATKSASNASLSVVQNVGSPSRRTSRRHYRPPGPLELRFTVVPVMAFLVGVM
jgi:hypothetical protein